MLRLFICALIFSTPLVLFLENSQAYGVSEIPERLQKQCESKYEAYKKFGSSYLIEKYPQISDMYQCLELFEDKNWTFNGKDRIDKFYEKQSLLTSVNGIKIRNLDNQNLGIENRGVIPIGTDYYLVKVRMCLEGRQISEPKFFVVADKEYFLALGNIIVKENSCSLGTIYVKAQNPENLQFFSFNGNYVPSKYMAIKTIY